ncbi:MAG: citrate/2-methylcitrate synthase [Eubacteriales bacterium]|nr:citrate/2-methylcitrate synthase [Eubacteriales bacterium]
MDRMSEYYGFLSEIAQSMKAREVINTELYKKYNVKRGLRNADGTGVLVGLTAIGEVHGYIVDENEKVDVEGKLYYRGIDVEDLIARKEAENRFGFEETIFLLLFGTLPTKDELEHFNKMMQVARNLPRGFAEDMIIRVPSKDIMNKLATSVLGLYCYDDNPDERTVANVLRQSAELIARMPAMIAYCYNAKQHYLDKESLHIHEQDPSLSLVENFLSLIRPDRKFTDEEAKLLDTCLILHAEHGGGNNSSFTAHVISSTGTDTYSAVSASIGALKGPRHGGANKAVMAMMDDIEANVKDWNSDDEVAAYLEKILRKEANDNSGLIYGMGHAVYTVSDPRTTILRQNAERLAYERGFEKEYQLYTNIERLSPEVFSKVRGMDKKICANVDLYSGFVYKILGIDPALYTPMFAMGRSVGWCAHVIEEVAFGGKIIRPAYKSVCKRAQYIPLEDR